MQNRFFSKYFKNVIDFDAFVKAVRARNSEDIDTLLAAKAKGYELEINHPIYAGNCHELALEILLRHGDFVNARKLLFAGAKTKVDYEIFVEDYNPFPCGTYEPRCLDLFQIFGKDKQILEFLHSTQAEVIQSQTAYTRGALTSVLSHDEIAKMLPNEMLCHISKFLTRKDGANLAQVNKQAVNMARKEELEEKNRYKP